MTGVASCVRNAKERRSNVPSLGHAAAGSVSK